MNFTWETPERIYNQKKFDMKLSTINKRKLGREIKELTSYLEDLKRIYNPEAKFNYYLGHVFTLYTIKRTEEKIKMLQHLKNNIR